ncbi:MAG: Ig-like domain-containing protein, partial [Oscillospiraceae bacterium]|nr:Ig-like domain-containing protein [Oscillospiraceae bacterium]
MKRSRKQSISVFLVSLLMMVFLTALDAPAQAIFEKVNVTVPCPKLTITSTTGEALTTTGFDGKAKLFVLYSSGCGYSQNAIKMIARSEWVGHPDLDVVAVSVDESETLEDIQTFASLMGASGKGIAFCKGSTDETYLGFMNAMIRCGVDYYNAGIIATPTLYIVDGRNNIVAYNNRGDLSEQQLVEILSEYIDVSIPVAEVSVKGTFDYTQANEVLRIVNEERAKAGLSALTMNETLLEAAMLRAAECSLSYSHTRPNGDSCFTAVVGMNYTSAGENIAVGQRNAEAVMNSWMNSPGHRSNILDTSYTDIGIGCFYQDNVLYWCQMFAGGCEKDSVEKSGTQGRTISIEIKKDLLSLKASVSKSTLSVGDTEKLVIQTTNPGFTSDTTTLENSSFTYSSSNTGVAKVSSTGTVTAVASGTAIITGKFSDDSVAFTTSITVGNSTTLSKPTLTVNSGTGSVAVSWTAVGGAEKYEVYRSDGNGTTLKLLTTTSKTLVTDSSVKMGEKYYYAVRAVKGNVKGEFSEVKSITCPVVLTAPTGISASNKASTGKIVLKWDKVTGAEKYEIWRALKGGTYSKIFTTTGTSLTNTSPVAGKI